MWSRLHCNLVNCSHRTLQSAVQCSASCARQFTATLKGDASQHRVLLFKAMLCIEKRTAQCKVLHWASGGIMESLVKELLLAQNSCLNCPPLSLLLLCTTPLFFIALHCVKVHFQCQCLSYVFSRAVSQCQPPTRDCCPHVHQGQKLSLSDFTLFTFCPASPLFCASDMTPFLLFFVPFQLFVAWTFL